MRKAIRKPSVSAINERGEPIVIFDITHGLTGIVSEEDRDLVDKFAWLPVKRYLIRVSTNKATGKAESIYLHCTILERKLGRPLTKDEEADHIDRNKSNCARSNLRLATHSQNGMNKAPQSNNTSGYKGVSKHYHNGFWRADICIKGHRKALGSYFTPEEAAIAYNHAATEHFKEFAFVNDIPGWQSITPVRIPPNQKPRRDNTSGYTNIGFRKDMGKWHARANVGGKRFHLGFFDTLEEARKAQCKAQEEAA